MRAHLRGSPATPCFPAAPGIVIAVSLVPVHHPPVPGCCRYTPKTNIRDGLAAFVEWFFDYYGADGTHRPDDEKGYVPD
jgi:hypothetical protein